MHWSVFLLKRYRIVFSYHQVQEHPKLFLAMTGLTQAEFDPLLQHFQCAWDQYVQQNYVDRDDRQRQYGGGRLGCLNRLLSVDRFLDSRCQSRLSSAWWRN